MATNALPATPLTRRFARRRGDDPTTLGLSSPVAARACEAGSAAVAPAAVAPAAEPGRSSPGADGPPSSHLTGETIEISTFSAMRGSTLVAGLVLLLVAATLLLAGHAMQFDSWPADPSPAAPEGALRPGPDPGYDLAVPAPERAGAELIRRRDRRSARNVAAGLGPRADARRDGSKRAAPGPTKGPAAGARPAPGRSVPLTAPPGAETAPLTGGGASGGSPAVPAPAPPSPAGQPRTAAPAAPPGG